METTLLEKVLACDRLPTLPAVAVQALEMMKDENVSVAAIAEVVQNDQGLTAKILKTVNSSFYGLSKPCSNLKQAQLLLGLSALKTLALGFSLVGALGKEQDDGFDYEEYWRRAILSGVAAKAVAVEIRCGGAEEAFLGGLLQDVGMIALHKTLGPVYGKLLRQAGERHEELSALEYEELETTHAHVGAALAEKWRLPPALVMPIKHHEHPTAAPKGHADIVRCVGLGSLAAAALSREDPTPWVARFFTRAREWFAIEKADAESILRKAGEGGRVVASLLETPIGDPPLTHRILEEANARLEELSLEREREVERTLVENQRMHEAVTHDALTGLHSRRYFNGALRRTFQASKSQHASLSLLFVDADLFHRVNDAHGWDVGDAVLAALAERLREALAPERRAVLARYGGEEFAILLPGCDVERSGKLAESVRLAVAGQPLSPQGVEGAPVDLTVSVGLACLEQQTHAVFEKPEQLLNAADRAVHAAKACGGDCVRVFVPRCKKAA